MPDNLPLLCLGTGLSVSDVCPEPEQLEIIKNAGFDAFFFDKPKKSDFRPTETMAEKGAKLGLRFQSLHAPFYGMDDVWHDEEGELSAVMINDLLNSIDECSRFGIPTAVMHAVIGMDNHNPTQLGIDRLEKVIDLAVKRGVRLAFENTEGEEYLARILEAYGDVPEVGFCIDTGHEMCYNYSENLIGRYGKYLTATHLNDNMGMTGTEITFYDDAHLLPFDGIADWEKIAGRLKKAGYDGILTFEVIKNGRPGRDTHKRYEKLSVEEYIALAYEKAVRFGKLLTAAE